MKLGIVPGPATPMEPNLFADHGTLATGSICGEFLNMTNPDLTLSPQLALRAGSRTRRATSGRTRCAGRQVRERAGDDGRGRRRDIQEPHRPEGRRRSAVGLQGRARADRRQGLGDYTVVFTLDAPTASFPYLTSNTTYQAIILPASYQEDTSRRRRRRPAAFNLVSYTPGVGAKFERNRGLVGRQDPARRRRRDLLRRRGGRDRGRAERPDRPDEPDVLRRGPRDVLSNPKLRSSRSAGTPHREISMLISDRRRDQAVRGPRVRQALALTLDRPAIIKQLFNGFADLGNDSPFAPIYPSTNKSVPQRRQNLALAKKLLAQAGYPNGFDVTMTIAEVPGDPAARPDPRRLGEEDRHRHQAQRDDRTPPYYAGTYSGGKTGRGTTPWLNTPLNITDYGHRAVPNVFLTSAFKTGGVWNAADYSNKTFDKAVDAYTAALTLSQQRKFAGVAERILLRDTPVIIPYFFKWTQAAVEEGQGLRPVRDRDAVPVEDLARDSAGRRSFGPGRRETQRPGARSGGGCDRSFPAQAARLCADHAVHPQRARLRGRVAAAREHRPERPRQLRERAGRRDLQPRGRRRPAAVTQYVDWITSFVRGDLGTSYQYQVPVSDLLGPSFANSLKLAAVAFVIVVPLSIIGGTFAGLRRNSLTDRVITITGVSFTAIPEFVTAIVFILVFGLWLGWLPVSATAPEGANVATQVEYLLLPSFALVVVLFGYIARITRASVDRVGRRRLHAHRVPRRG